ncbi:unnamed protein product [Mortierella alpina]
MEDEEMYRDAMAELSLRLPDFDINRSFEHTLRGEAADDEMEVDASDESEDEDEADTAVDDDGTPSDTETLPLKETQAVLELQAEDKIHKALKNALFADPYIQETADDFSIPEDEAMSLNNEGNLVFVLKADYFLDWKFRHKDAIGTQFYPHSKEPHVYQRDDPEKGIVAGDSCVSYDLPAQAREARVPKQDT